MTSCRVVEFRRYALVPGRRDELVDVFDRELVEPQEALGLHVIGQFTDVDRPDRFTWFRGFASMAQRRAGLQAFYEQSEAWARNRATANATMLDSDDVLLLRPVAGVPSLCDAAGPRPEVDGPSPPGGVVTVMVHHLPADPQPLVDRWRERVVGRDDALVGALSTEHAANDYPRLPVVEGVEVLVVVRWYASHEERQRAAALPADAEVASADADLAAAETAPRELHVLEPTARSAFR